MKTSSTGLRARLFVFGMLVIIGISSVREPTGDEPLVRLTPPGSAVLIRGFAEVGPDCTLRPMPPVQVVDAPVNGRIEQRPGVVTIAADGVASKACAGKQLDGVQVYYVPNAGFVGSDHFSLGVADAGKPPVRATVEVAGEPRQHAKTQAL